MSRYEDLLDLIADPGDECIEWPWARHTHGYGEITWRGKKRRTHRLVLEVVTGRAGECALHSCDNPPCVNPRHLRWGTKGENNAEAYARGLKVGTKAHAILTPDNVREIRTRLDRGEAALALANEFGVKRPTIYGLKNGHTWADVA